MRVKVLLSAAVAAVAATLACAPAPAYATGDIVAVPGVYAPGTIVVKTGERHLYLMLGPGEALRYPVGVGRAGMQWSGTSHIDAKYISPAWAPPPRSIRRWLHPQRSPSLIEASKRLLT